MSHRPERKEKDCLNCGTIVSGRYCQHCGQENTEPGMTLVGLIQHFFYDITHFDGKYFDTLRHLFRKPGFLSKAFMQGKRSSYVDPVRMYIFTSAFFFLLFYSFFLKLDEKGMESQILSTTSLLESIQKLDTGNNNYLILNNAYLIRNKKDTLLVLKDTKAFNRFMDSLTKQIREKNLEDSIAKPGMSFFMSDLDYYPSRKSYDSVQQLLPDAKRDGWLRRLMVYRQISIQDQYKGNTEKFLAHTIDRFLHSFPTLLFVSLPLLTLLLKLLYIRHKEYLYVFHGIYLIHLYIFTFLLLIFFFLISQANYYLPFQIWGWLQFGLFIWLMVYTYKSMRKFYGQSKGKTILKMLIFLLGSLLIMVGLFLIYFAYMALKG